MFRSDEVRKYLEAHKEEFIRTDEEFREEIRMLRSVAQSQRNRTAEEIRNELDFPDGKPGAFPTDEWIAGSESWLPFQAHPPDGSSNQSWAAWAEGVLRGTTTFAVDGSQIYPTSDWSFPLAAVQVGYFENKHSAGGFTKDAVFFPIPPAELAGDGADESNLREAVNLRRHRLEVKTLVEWMQRDAPSQRRLALFDGTLVVSFAAAGEHRLQYVAAVQELLRASHATRTPLVAYIDSSRARDVAHMYAKLSGLAETRVPDGLLLPDSGWGRRTPAFICARAQGLENYGELARQVCFVYLRSNRSGRPARLEFPRWMLEDGLAESAVQMVRAEIVAQAAGYPYAIETVDAVAVLTAEDRLKFEALFQEFAERHGLRTFLRAKAASKRRRRS